MSQKIREIQIADDIIAIVEQEVGRIKAKRGRDPTDLIALEKLSKVYSIIASSNREDLKYGVLGRLSDKELEDLEGELGEGGESDDT